MKTATRGRGKGAWQLAFQRGNGFAPAASCGHGCHERLGVGVRSTVKKGFCGAFFHNLPEVHHKDATAQKAHYSQIVRNEKIGWAKLLLHFAQKVEGLRLH